MQTITVAVLEGRTRICASYAPGEDSKAAFLFVHGLAQNETSGKVFLRFFRERGHSVLSFDWPGHGASDLYPTQDIKMETLVATLQGVLKHFEVQPPLIVAGHSLGGMVALDWATTYPALVKSLILVSASDLPPVKGNKTFDLRPMIAKVIVDAEKIFVKQQKMDFALNAEISEGEILALGLMHTDKDSLKQFFAAAEDYDVRDKLSCLTVPCLIFRGREDLLIDEGMTREMQKRLATSRLITVPGGHNWFLQRPHLMIDALEENYGFLLNGEAKHLVS